MYAIMQPDNAVNSMFGLTKVKSMLTITLDVCLQV